MPRYGRYTEFTLIDNDSIVLPANPHRRFLRVQNATNTAQGWIAFGIPATANQSWQTATFNKSEDFYYRDIGPLVGAEIHGRTTIVPSVPITLIEGIDVMDPYQKEAQRAAYPPRLGRYSEPSVTQTSAVILSADAHRRFIAIQNPGSDNIYLAFGRTAVYQQSYGVIAGGQSERFYYEDFGGLITGDIMAITGSGEVIPVAVLEGFAPILEPSTVGRNEAALGMS